MTSSIEEKLIERLEFYFGNVITTSLNKKMNNLFIFFVFIQSNLWRDSWLSQKLTETNGFLDVDAMMQFKTVAAITTSKKKI